LKTQEERLRIKQEVINKIRFVNDETWEWCLKSDKITLLFFMSTENLACREQIPQIVAFSQEHGDTYNIAVCDYDTSPEAVEACEIDGTPMFVILRRGVILGGRRGGLPHHREELIDFVKQLSDMQKMSMDAFIADRSQVSR